MPIPLIVLVSHSTSLRRIQKPLATLFLATVLAITGLTYDVEKASGGQVARGIVGEGACAISGMSADQSQLIALQQARSSVIEKAAGIQVVSSTLVRNNAVALDLIRTYSRGFIVREKVTWLPLAQHQDSPDRPPIPVYRVRISADVAIPERRERPPGLSATLNNKVFRKGETARLEVRTERAARVAVFNITADDRVVMLFPHPYEKENLAQAGTPLKFPPEGSPIRLEMSPLPGHARDAEAFFITAVAAERDVDYLAIFGSGKPMPLAAFFGQYAEMAPYSEEIILPYAVEGNE